MKNPYQQSASPASAKMLGSRWWVAVFILSALLIFGSYADWWEWLRTILGIGVMFAVCRAEHRPRVTIESLWLAMPRDVQRKISCYDLKRTVDNFNAEKH
ncbi:MAG: hypothetical protein QM680_01030 [Luteolibacter sp.]